MADIVLFHSILGLRSAERELAARWQADGHAIILPDLHGGQSAENYDGGFRLQSDIGEAEIIRRATEVLADAPETAVLAGISYGAFIIGKFWGGRPQMRGALLMSGCAEWAPTLTNVPVHVHIARPDAFDDEAFIAQWSDASPGAALEIHRYDGAGHFFLDRQLPDFDAVAASLCLDRCQRFLHSL